MNDMKSNLRLFEKSTVVGAYIAENTMSIWAKSNDLEYLRKRNVEGATRLRQAMDRTLPISY